MKIIKKYSEYLLPFFVSGFIIIVFCFINKVNIHSSFIVNDLHAQYTSLMTYLKNALIGNDSLLYSFSNGIGGNMMSTIAYYLVSPFNILILFFKDVNVAITLGIIFRFCFANLTMYIYLKHKYKSNINPIIFSTIYAFSGYMVNYYSNIMWLDILILLPIILVQIDNLMNEKKCTCLPILLGLSLVISFYLSYMVYIFIIIYFINELILKGESKDYNKNVIKRLIVNMFLGGLISSMLLLPNIMDMFGNIFRVQNDNNLLNIDFYKIPMIISKLFIGTIDSATRYSHYEANIYITLFGLFSIIKYFFNSKITKREKISTIIIIMIFISSIFFEFFSLIWHGFSFPNGYNYRFTFLLIFFLVNIIYKQYINNEKMKLKNIIIIDIIFILICIMMYNLNYSYLSIDKIIMSLVFFMIYSILSNKSNKILIAVILIEIVINFNCSFLTEEVLLESSDWDKNVIFKLCEEVKELNRDGRITSSVIISSNDGFLCNTKDFAVTSSSNNKRYYQFMSNMGYTVTYSTIMKNINIGPFVPSILGVSKQLQFNSNLEHHFNLIDVREHKFKDENVYTYYHTNDNALSVGYLIENSSAEYSDNAFENQNMIAKQMSGLDLNIFEKIELTEVEDGYYQYKNDKDLYYFYNYFPITRNAKNYITVFINDEYLFSLDSFHRNIMRVEKENKDTNTLKIGIDDEKYSEYINPLLYTFNEDNYQIIMDKLKKNQMDILYFEKNKIKGKIQLEENGTIMISVPYEKGWHIKVNGKIVNYYEVYDTFIGIDLQAGENNIEMIFIPPGLILGILITIISFIFVRVNKFKKLFLHK